MQTSENRDRNDLSFHSIVLPVFQRNRRSSSEPLVQPVILMPTHIFVEKVSEMLLRKLLKINIHRILHLYYTMIFKLWPCR